MLKHMIRFETLTSYLYLYENKDFLSGLPDIISFSACLGQNAKTHNIPQNMIIPQKGSDFRG